MNAAIITRRAAILTAAILVLAAGCRHMSSNADNVFGSGIVLRESRSVSAFHTIEISGACHLFISQGIQSVEVEAEDNILPLVLTRVGYDGVLLIENRGSINTDVGIKVYVSLNELRGIRVFGAAMVSSEHRLSCQDVKLELAGATKIFLELEAQSLETRIEGAGEAILQGRVISHHAVVEGAGTIKALGLETRISTVVLSGAGCCYVSVSGNLDVTIAGVGNVYYRGNPKTLKSNVSGMGKLIKLN